MCCKYQALQPLLPFFETQQSSWVPLNVAWCRGAALVILGLPVLYAKLAGPTGRLGLIGVLLVALVAPLYAPRLIAKLKKKT